MKYLIFLLFLTYDGMAKPLKFVTEALPPYQVVNKRGQLVAGTSYALIKNLLDNIQVEAKIELMPWARAYRTALTDKNTFIFSIARSAQREPLFHWIAPLRQLRFHFYGLQKPDDGIHLAKKPLLELRVVAVRGSIEEDLLRQIGFTIERNLLLTDNYLSAWRMLLLGRVDAIYANEYVKNGVNKQLGFKESPFYIHYSMNQVLELYVAANLNTDPELISLITRQFEKMKNNGQMKEIIAEQERLVYNTKK